jgi:hypothetical protein
VFIKFFGGADERRSARPRKQQAIRAAQRLR